MSDISNYGIILEMFGFVILLLVGGRNPNASYRVTDGHKEAMFDSVRAKIIPNKVVNMFLIIGIGSIIMGLAFQFSWLE